MTIVEVIARSVTTIRKLATEYKEADLSVLSLITQLSALGSALSKIAEWVRADDVEQHHQFVMDLDLSLSCCEVLLTKLDGHLSELHQNPDGTLDIPSRLRLIFQSSSVEQLEKMIERQTSALALLLQAINW